jgi:hypothetical protein
MTFNVEEKHAVGGAAAAMLVPTVADTVGVDSLIVSLADTVFEGDRGSASFVSGIGFSVIGAGMILGAVLGPVDDALGVAVAGLGVGFIGLGLRSFAEGGE